MFVLHSGEMLRVGDSHRGYEDAALPLFRVSIVLVSVLLLIKLQESPICRQSGSKEACLSVNWGSAPQQQFSLASPMAKGELLEG